MNKFFESVNNTFFYSLFISGVLSFFISSNLTLGLSFMLAFFSSWAFSIILTKRGLKSHYNLFINLALWGSMLGILYFYKNSFPYFDKILHFSIGLMIMAIVYNFYKQKAKIPNDMVFSTVLGMLCLWEIFEYLIQVFFGYNTMGVFHKGILVQSSLDDTFLDLIFGSIGAISYLLFKKPKP